MGIVGTPGGELLNKMQSEEARNYIKSLPIMEKKDFRQYFAGSSPAAIDLLEKMLVLDPDYRSDIDFVILVICFGIDYSV